MFDLQKYVKRNSQNIAKWIEMHLLYDIIMWTVNVNLKDVNIGVCGEILGHVQKKVKSCFQNYFLGAYAPMQGNLIYSPSAELIEDIRCKIYIYTVKIN